MADDNNEHDIGEGRGAMRSRGPLQIEDIDVAAPREDEVLVRMVGVCHTDIGCRDGNAYAGY